jgi:sugar O-acyltransferase (sialic acid O-acetyltransferase NeuD family)
MSGEVGEASPGMSHEAGRTATVILVGAGRFAEETTDVAADAGVAIAAWIEGLDPARADPASDPPILWVDHQAAFRPDLPIVPAIGSVRRRALVERLLAEGRALATVVHPSAVVARSAVVEAGCVIFPGVVIGARSRVGAGTIVNRGALIGHHTTIGAHSFIGPGATIAGGVEIGEEAWIGIGAIVRDDRRIGRGVTVGAGAVVVGDVGEGVTVIGLPARPMERT